MLRISAIDFFEMQVKSEKSCCARFSQKCQKHSKFSSATQRKEHEELYKLRIAKYRSSIEPDLFAGTSTSPVLNAIVHSTSTGSVSNDGVKDAKTTVNLLR